MCWIKNYDDYEKKINIVDYKYIFEISNDTRKFEIDLYWKRSHYFILFIGATLTAYLAIYGLNGNAASVEKKEVILYLLNCLGIITTWTWFLSLKGSKYWQENWEKHVSFNQKRSIGPLFDYVHVVEKYKYPPGKFFNQFAENATRSSPYSVSKLNMLLSIFILILWINIFIFISNEGIVKIILNQFSINYELDDMIKVSLLLSTLLYVCIVKKYGSSSFKEKIYSNNTNGTEFIKI